MSQASFLEVEIVSTFMMDFVLLWLVLTHFNRDAFSVSYPRDTPATLLRHSRDTKQYQIGVDTVFDVFAFIFYTRLRCCFKMMFLKASPIRSPATFVTEIAGTHGTLWFGSLSKAIVYYFSDTPIYMCYPIAAEIMLLDVYSFWYRCCCVFVFFCEKVFNKESSTSL